MHSRFTAFRTRLSKGLRLGSLVEDRMPVPQLLARVFLGGGRQAVRLLARGAAGMGSAPPPPPPCTATDSQGSGCTDGGGPHHPPRDGRKARPLGDGAPLTHL